MKKLLTILLLAICINSNAQTTINITSVDPNYRLEAYEISPGVTGYRMVPVGLPQGGLGIMMAAGGVFMLGLATQLEDSKYGVKSPKPFIIGCGLLFTAVGVIFTIDASPKKKQPELTK